MENKWHSVQEKVRKVADNTIQFAARVRHKDQARLIKQSLLSTLTKLQEFITTHHQQDTEVDVQWPVKESSNGKLILNQPIAIRERLWRYHLRHVLKEDNNFKELLREGHLKRNENEIRGVIIRDIGRTFAGHPLFSEREGRIALFSILRAYSMYDYDVGYCQGMNFVAGVLLMHLPPQDAYVALKFLMQRVNLRVLYLPDMNGVQILFWQLEVLFEKRSLALFDHFVTHGVLTILYAASWFLTAFTSEFPIRFASRIIDILFLQKSTIVFLKMALALLKYAEEYLLQLNSFEDIVQYMKRSIPDLPLSTLHSILTTALQDPLTSDDLPKYSENTEPQQIFKSNSTDLFDFHDMVVEDDKSEMNSLSCTDNSSAGSNSMPKDPIFRTPSFNSDVLSQLLGLNTTTASEEELAKNQTDFFEFDSFEILKPHSITSFTDCPLNIGSLNDQQLDMFSLLNIDVFSGRKMNEKCALNTESSDVDLLSLEDLDEFTGTSTKEKCLLSTDFSDNNDLIFLSPQRSFEPSEIVLSGEELSYFLSSSTSI